MAEKMSEEQSKNISIRLSKKLQKLESVPEMQDSSFKDDEEVEEEDLVKALYDTWESWSCKRDSEEEEDDELGFGDASEASPTTLKRVESGSESSDGRFSRWSAWDTKKVDLTKIELPATQPQKPVGSTNDLQSPSNSPTVPPSFTSTQAISIPLPSLPKKVSILELPVETKHVVVESPTITTLPMSSVTTSQPSTGPSPPSSPRAVSKIKEKEKEKMPNRTIHIKTKKTKIKTPAPNPIPDLVVVASPPPPPPFSPPVIKKTTLWVMEKGNRNSPQTRSRASLGQRETKEKKNPPEGQIPEVPVVEVSLQETEVDEWSDWDSVSDMMMQYYYAHCALEEVEEAVEDSDEWSDWDCASDYMLSLLDAATGEVRTAETLGRDAQERIPVSLTNTPTPLMTTENPPFTLQETPVPLPEDLQFEEKEAITLPMPVVPPPPPLPSPPPTPPTTSPSIPIKTSGVAPSTSHTSSGGSTDSSADIEPSTPPSPPSSPSNTHKNKFHQFLPRRKVSIKGNFKITLPEENREELKKADGPNNSTANSETGLEALANFHQTSEIRIEELSEILEKIQQGKVPPKKSPEAFFVEIDPILTCDSRDEQDERC